METRDELIRRIASFQLDSLPESTLTLNPDLDEKVSAGTGALRPFFGSTTAYYLDDAALDLVAHVTDVLYAHHADDLCERLPLHQAHVTLHDLRASTRLDDVAADVFRDGEDAATCLRAAQALGPVTLTCTAVFNLVSMSIAIGLQPASDDNHERLHQARALFDPIVASKLFTPHITLAYYRPEQPSPIDVPALRKRLADLTDDIRGTEVALNPSRLHVLHFDSMAHYWPTA